MTSGPIELLICAKGAEGVIEDLRALVGPAVSVGASSPPSKEEAEKVQMWSVHLAETFYTTNNLTLILSL